MADEYAVSPGPSATAAQWQRARDVPRRTAANVSPKLVRPSLWIAVWLAALAVAGCQLAGRLDERLDVAAASARQESLSDPTRTSRVGTAEAGADSRTAGSGRALEPGDIPSPLLHDTWVRRVPPDSQSTDPQVPRWRHAGLEDLLARPADQLPDFAVWLDDENPIVAGNAAICLARLGAGHPAARLADTVRRPELNMAMRAAATEALGQVPAPAAVPRLKELIGQYAGGLSQTGSSGLPALHGELIRAFGRLAPSEAEPLLSQALQSPAPSVRIEALRAWPRTGTAALPAEVADACQDRDPQVRVEALQLIVARRPADLHDSIDRALRDEELSVRLAAIAGLQELADSAACETARRLAESPNPMIRVAAVNSLAGMGAAADVWAAVNDTSRRVRRAVAANLDCHPTDPRSLAVARQLVTDPSSDVACQVVAAVDHWPLERAVPVLLLALESSGYSVRKAAAEQLGRRWSPARQFPIDEPPSRRAEALAVVRGQWADQVGRDATGTQPAVEGGHCQRPGADHRCPVAADGPRVADRRRVEMHLQILSDPARSTEDHRRAEQALIELGPPVVETIEQMTRGSKRPLPLPLYRAVLPRVDAVFEILARFESPDLEQRRKAATALVNHVRCGSLSDLALTRLEVLVLPELDANVWWSVEIALADDGREAAARIHLAALSHPAVEVRRRACAYLARLGDPEHLPPVLATLDDPNPVVVRAAVAALGEIGARRQPPSPPQRCPDRDEQPGNPAGVPHVVPREPLERLLASRDATLQLAVAHALAKLGYASGEAALERLALHDDPTIRRQVAEAMGTLGRPVFIAALTGLLDDRLGVRKAALASLQQITQEHTTPGADGGTPSLDEQIRTWKHRDAAGKSPDTTVP